MAIKHLNYKAIPRERRKRQASRAAGKMREMLHLDPTVTEEQRVAVERRIRHLNKWTNGELDPGPAPTLAQPPKHEVVVEEKMGVDDGSEPKVKKAAKKDS